MQRKYIKIYGIERSGTVFTQELIDLNLKGTYPISNGFGWKHGEVQDHLEWLNGSEADDYFKEAYNSEVGCVIVIKNPYSWYNSIKRFIRRTPEYQPFDIFEQYRRYNRLYLHWHKELIEKWHPFYKRAMVVKYEDLLSSTETLHEMAAVMGCELNDPLIVPEKVDLSEPFTDDRKRMYLNVDVPDKPVVKIINSLISDKLFNLYNYERLDCNPLF